MFTWTMDATRTDLNDPVSARSPRTMPARGLSYAARDGRMRILGVDLRLDGRWLGDGYLGFSSIKTANVGVLSDTIEVLHSQGGWQYQANYTGSTNSHGDSTVNSIGFQYTFSWRPFSSGRRSGGDKARTSPYRFSGMYNRISGLATTDEERTALAGKSKLKLGTQWL